jgi:hypothetical protein
MAKKQIIVRTYPPGYTKTLAHMQEKLAEGYIVVMCNPITNGKGEIMNDYILEIETKPNA